jgi:hypothetical protein
MKTKRGLKNSVRIKTSCLVTMIAAFQNLSLRLNHCRIVVTADEHANNFELIITPWVETRACPVSHPNRVSLFHLTQMPVSAGKITGHGLML